MEADMTDRELLELAAKAAGMQVLLEGVKWPREEVGWFFNQVGDHPPALYDRSGPSLQRWAPLTDDGDALRLAVKLNLTVQFPWEDKCRFTKETHVWSAADAPVQEPHGADAAEATRRAIVRAAAEIGRSA
jgi:hypothetical protein